LGSENETESKKAALSERHLVEAHFADQSGLFADLICGSGKQL
jgi:hypothetical protein